MRWRPKHPELMPARVLTPAQSYLAARAVRLHARGAASALVEAATAADTHGQMAVADRDEALRRAASPVVDARGKEGSEPTEGVALCLSGGGYRAMLFHAGALLRLNELGWLRQLSRVSSVSGGSITAGALGVAWKELEFGAAGVASNLRELVLQPLHQLTDTTIDVRAILLRALGPGSIGEGVAASYRRHLFGSATLQDLPNSAPYGGHDPRFVFNATSLQSGVLRRAPT